MSEVFFDYNLAPGCEYPDGPFNEDGDQSECGEPIYAEIWWKEDQSDLFCLCKKHFDFVYERESTENAKGENDA